MPITTRKLWIKPTGTKEEIKEIEKELYQIDDNYYMAANLVVADCFNEYWTKDINDIQFFMDQRKVDEVEEMLVPAIQELHKKETTVERKDELRKVIGELKKEKDQIIRYVQKRNLSKECETKPILNQLINQFKTIPESVLFYTVFQITQRFLKELISMREAKYKYPYYTKGAPFPIGFDDNDIPLYIKDGSSDIFFKWKVDSTKEIEFVIDFGKDKGEVRKIMELFLTKELDHTHIGDSTIKADKNRERLYVQLVIKEPAVIPPPLNKGLVLGVDVGYTTPIYWGLSDFSDSGVIGDGNQIKAKRAQFNMRLKEVSESLKFAQTGHGKIKKLQALRVTIREKESNYFKNLYRDQARQVVETALLKGAGMIKLEHPDFKKMIKEQAKQAREQNMQEASAGKRKIEKNKNDKKLEEFQYWAFSKTLRFIEEKAEKAGIEVVYIKPEFTSKKCHGCGLLGERLKQYLVFDYKCERDYCPLHEKKIEIKNGKYSKWQRKWVVSADENSAFNIANWTEIDTKNV